MSTPQPHPDTITGDTFPRQWINYPFVALADHRQSGLKQDYEGYIKDISPNEREARVVLTNPRKPGDLVVPCKFIRVGTVRPYGKPQLLIVIPQKISSGVQKTNSNNIGLTTLLNLVDAFSNIPSGKIIGSNIIETKLSSAAKRWDYKFRLQNSAPDETKTLLSNPNFSISDLRSLPLVQTKPNSRGVYIIVDKNENIYPGFTSRTFETRRSEHIDDMSSTYTTKNPKILALRRAGDFTMHVFLEFDGSKSHNFNSIAEQATINLTGSYFWPLIIPTRGDTPAEVLRSSFDSHSFQYHATILTRVAADCFEQTGWKPITQRPGSGVGHGLNVQSPLAAAIYGKTLWLKQILDPHQMMTFRRGAKTACNTSDSHLLALSLRTNLGGPALTVEPDTERGLLEETPVITVFEIMAVDKPHPQAWARLPRVGRWGDWGVAQRIAVRIEWQNQNGGKWWTKYLCASGYGFATTKSGAHSTYNQAMGMWRFFTQTEKTAFHPWDLQLGQCMVKEIRNNHLRQEVMATTPPWPAQTIQLRGPRDRKAVRDELAAIGFRNINGPFGSFNARGDSFGRARCDGCYLNKVRQCERIGTSNQCKSCWKDGHDCSWTSTSEITSARFAGAINYLPRTKEQTEPTRIPEREVIAMVESD